MATPNALFENWLRQERRLSARSANEYARCIQFLRDKRGLDPTAMRADEVAERVNELTAESSVPTHNLYVSTLRHYQDYLNWRGSTHKRTLPYEFAKGLKAKPKPRRLPKPLDFKEVFAIITKAPEGNAIELRNKAILHLLYCGLRNEEVVNLNVGSFTLNDDGTGILRVVGKGNKERIVPVNAAACDVLIKYLVLSWGEAGNSFQDLEMDPDYPLFVTGENVRVGTRQVRQIVYDAAERAGVDGAHPHRLRHSFATHLLDFGVTDMFALRDVMGHAKLETTQQYVLVSTQAKRDRINKFHPMQLGVEP